MAADGRLEAMVFDIEKFALHDGPGLRTAVFLKGCPLRCAWCHNPESQVVKPELAFVARNCIEGCDECIRACPKGALVGLSDTSPRAIAILRERCDSCFDCVSACPAEAMAVVGQRMSVDEVLAKVKRNQSFYRHSGGGVTVTGGEPLVYWQFVAALLRRCQEAGIHTAVDTCGHGPWEHLAEMLRSADLLLYDLKESDPAKHERFTGVPNHLVLDNLRRASTLGVPIAIRLPLIPGYTGTEENVRAIGAFVGELANIKEIELLPYHRLGETKYKLLDRGYGLGGLQPPSDEEVDNYRHILQSMGHRVQVGG